MGMKVFQGSVTFPPDSTAADGIVAPVVGEPGWQSSRLPIPGAPAGATLLVALTWFSLEFAGTERPLHRLAVQAKVLALISDRSNVTHISEPRPGPAVRCPLRGSGGLPPASGPHPAGLLSSASNRANLRPMGGHDLPRSEHDGKFRS